MSLEHHVVEGHLNSHFSKAAKVLYQLIQQAGEEDRVDLVQWAHDPQREGEFAQHLFRARGTLLRRFWHRFPQAHRILQAYQRLLFDHDRVTPLRGSADWETLFWKNLLEAVPPTWLVQKQYRVQVRLQLVELALSAVYRTVDLAEPESREPDDADPDDGAVSYDGHSASHRSPAGSLESHGRRGGDPLAGLILDGSY